MEVIDRQGMCVRLYPLVQQALNDGKLDAEQLHALIERRPKVIPFQPIWTVIHR